MYEFSAYTPKHKLPFTLPYPQSNLYKSLQENQGFDVEQFVITQEGQTIGYFQIIFYPLIKKMVSGYIPYGPVLTKSDTALLEQLAQFLHDLGDKKNAVYIRSDFQTANEPNLPILYKPIPDFAYKTVYHQPRGEWLLDITPEPQELLAQMHKKTRYNINKSLKQDLETSFYSGASIEGWADTFIALNDQNTAGHNTTTHPKKYFKDLFKLATESDDNFIAITRKEGHVLAINIFIKTGDSVFCPFGASNDLGKKLGAYYHIKWHSILEMKERGVRIFNWGGVSVGSNDKYLAGVTKFKSGFGGYSVNHSPLHDIIIKPLWYWIYMARKFLTK